VIEHAANHAVSGYSTNTIATDGVVCTTAADIGKCAGKIDVSHQPLLWKNHDHLAMKEPHITMVSWKRMVDIEVSGREYTESLEFIVTLSDGFRRQYWYINALPLCTYSEWVMQIHL